MRPQGAGRRAALVPQKGEPGNAARRSPGSSTSATLRIGTSYDRHGERKGERGTYHWVYFDLVLRPRRELTQRKLLALALDRETCAVGSRGRHPNVWVRRVAHPSADGNALQLARQDVEHRLSRNKRGRGERDGQHVARAIVVAAGLVRALRDMDRIQTRYLGRGEVIERGVHVPAVEASDAGCLVGRRDGRLVRGGVGGVLECDALEALVVVYGAVADKLHLRYARDGFEIGEDGI